MKVSKNMDITVNFCFYTPFSNQSKERLDCLRVSLDNTPTESRTFERNPFVKNAFEEALNQMRKLKEEEEEQRREIKFESLKTQYSPAKNIVKTIQAATNPRKVNKSSSITVPLQDFVYHLIIIESPSATKWLISKNQRRKIFPFS